MEEYKSANEKLNSFTLNFGNSYFWTEELKNLDKCFHNFDGNNIPTAQKVSKYTQTSNKILNKETLNFNGKLEWLLVWNYRRSFLCNCVE